MAVERFLGLDLAWGESRPGRIANESGLVILDPIGHVLDVAWTRGVEETLGRVAAAAGDESALLFVDAPLVAENSRGQRPCEKQVGQRYGRWKVSANTTNVLSPRLAGVALRRRLEAAGWMYSSGLGGPPTDGRTISECYSYNAGGCL